MRQARFLAYLKTLRPNEWRTKVSSHWTVKDAVAHMVGWEKEDCTVIPTTWKTKRRPWFYTTDDFDAFNRKNTQHYRNHTPAQLVREWEGLRKAVGMEVRRIGRARLQTRPDLFGWLFEDEDRKRKKPTHYEHHYRQIRCAVKDARRHAANKKAAKEKLRALAVRKALRWKGKLNERDIEAFSVKLGKKITKRR